MSSKVTQLGNFTIDAEKFGVYYTQGIEELRAAHGHKEEAKKAEGYFKDTVEMIASFTKIPKKEVSAYMKARFDETLPKEDDGKKVGTEVVIERGELYTVLNSSLEA